MTLTRNPEEILRSIMNVIVVRDKGGNLTQGDSARDTAMRWDEQGFLAGSVLVAVDAGCTDPELWRQLWDSGFPWQRLQEVPDGRDESIIALLERHAISLDEALCLVLDAGKRATYQPCAGFQGDYGIEVTPGEVEIVDDPDHAALLVQRLWNGHPEKEASLVMNWQLSTGKMEVEGDFWAISAVHAVIPGFDAGVI